MRKFIQKAMISVGMGQNNSSGGKPEQEKTVDITENGTTDVLPDDGYALSKVTVNANVPTTQTVPKMGFVPTGWITTVGSGQEAGAIEEGIWYGAYFPEYAFASHIDSNAHPFVSLRKLTIVDNISRIEKYAFANCRHLNLSKIPETVTSIGIYAFNKCAKITVSSLPLGVVKIEGYTFSGCRNIESFTIHSNVLSIGNYSFNDCTGMKTLSFEGVLTSDMATSSFSGCSALESVTIGNGWAVSIYLNSSSNLTQESLHGMIENLADLTGLTAKNFKVGATNLEKIDEDHIAMLNAKNWNYS